MKKIFVVVSAMMGLMTSCNQTVEKSVTGIVCDATMNGVTVVTVDNDTVFVSTLDAKDAGYTGNSFALNDTLTVDYKVMDGINVAESWQVKPVVAELIMVRGLSLLAVWMEKMAFCWRQMEKQLRLILRHLCIRLGNVKEIN